MTPTHELVLFSAAGLVRWGQRKNQNGRQPHQMLEEFDQMASNTFFSQGGFSWTSSTGVQAIIDCVAIPRQWASSLVVAVTHSEIVLGSGDFTNHKVDFAKVGMRAPGARTDLLRKPRVCDVRAAAEGGCIIERLRRSQSGLALIPTHSSWPSGLESSQRNSFPSQHAALETRGLQKTKPLPSLRRSSQCFAS